MKRFGPVGWALGAPLGILNHWLYGGEGWLIASVVVGFLAALIVWAHIYRAES